jgi:NitT/TauT family transport system permease protein
MLKEISLEMVIRLIGLGFFTFLRVLACVVLSSAVWLPVSFYVALHPDFAMKLRPLLEFGASFPANLFFPLLVMAFLALGIPLTFGSAVLMFAANQWYIAFNVIAGAVSVPRDLAEASEAMGLSFAQKVKNLIFPCIFPYWVTGAITSAGGAWNVSIISETLQFGSQTLECEGLGAAFTQATTSNHWPTIILNIVLMSTFVILANRLLWRPLYNYAITRYGGET